MIERGAVFLLLASSAVLFLSWAWTMATSSLWNDEIYSILFFTGRGVRTVVTDYHAPNNHVFFNLANALLPGRMPMDPLRARGLSILATAAALWLALRFFWARGLRWTGAVVVFLLASNGTLLELVLQARGYGFLLLFAAALASLLPLSLDPTGRLGLWATGALVVLGAYTVPTFAFFGALWLLALLAVRRDGATVLVGAAAGVTIVLLYLPLASQLLAQLRSFGNEWGRDFGTWRAVGEAVRHFALPSFGERPILPVRIALLIPFVLTVLTFLPIGGPSPGERTQARLLAVTSALFFLACRLLETPLVRTTSFVAVPLLLSAGLLAEGVAASVVPARARSWAAGVVSGLLVVAFARPMTPGRYVPLENWRGVSRFLESTFPPRLPVAVSWRDDFMAAHGPSDRQATGRLDISSFARGELLLFDDAYDHGSRFAVKAVSPPSAAVRFGQRRSDDRFTEVRFRPPQDRAILSLATVEGEPTVQKAYDGDFETGWRITPMEGDTGRSLVFTLLPKTSYRSLILAVGGQWQPSAQAWIATAEGWEFLPPGDLEAHEGVLVVHLRDRLVREVHVRLEALGRGKELVETWAYPSR